jgi:glycosyltransferase involved in cell wall biosynthesis
MMWQPDAVPSIRAERIALLANQSSRRVKGGPHELYEPDAVQARVSETFGAEGTWIPISPVVRRQMEETGGFAPVAHEDWFPVLDLDAWCREPHWRGDERARPVIGRHSRDHWIKWPHTAGDIAAAYCADRSMDVRLMGGAGTALRLLGRTPGNWQVLDFDAEPLEQFLDSLDIYVHFIHPESIEAFGRNIMEAMAMGVPVVCSPSFRECFGDAAVYAAPEDATNAIEALWRDEERYLAVARAGQRFVAEHCARTGVRGRLSRICPSLARDPAAA